MQQPTCSICFEHYELHEAISTTFCGHVFHSKCLSQWRRKEQSCPKCRAVITHQNIHSLFFDFMEFSPKNDPFALLRGQLTDLHTQVETLTLESIRKDSQNQALQDQLARVIKKRDFDKKEFERQLYLKTEDEKCKKQALKALREEIVELRSMATARGLKLVQHQECKERELETLRQQNIELQKKNAELEEKVRGLTLSNLFIHGHLPVDLKIPVKKSVTDNKNSRTSLTEIDKENEPVCTRTREKSMRQSHIMTRSRTKLADTTNRRG